MRWLAHDLIQQQKKQVSPMEAIAHTTSILFLIGMMVFFWLIYKKTRKVYRRGQKAKRRLLKYKNK
jgi:hypothetical protein